MRIGKAFGGGIGKGAGRAGCGMVLALALMAAPLPLAAQAETGTEDGASLIEQGAALLFRGLLSELAPEIEDMTGEMGAALALLAPAMGDLARLVDDIGNYELPERLENGDILIRRRADAPPPPPLGEGLQRFWAPDDEAPPEKAGEEAPRLDL